MIIQIVKITVKLGSEKEFEQAVADFILTVRQNEPDCLGFQACSSVDEAGVYYLYEQYVDKKALAFHRLTPHFKAFSQDYLPQVVAGRERILCTWLAGDLS